MLWRPLRNVEKVGRDKIKLFQGRAYPVIPFLEIETPAKSKKRSKLWADKKNVDLATCVVRKFRPN